MRIPASLSPIYKEASLFKRLAKNGQPPEFYSQKLDLDQMTSSKTILVTTATGTVGKLLARVLLEQQYNVHALVRSPDSEASRELEKLGVKLFKGDFDDLASIRAAAEGVDGVFVNALPTMGTTLEATHVGNIIAAAKDAGVSSTVYMSAYMLDRKEEFPGYDPKTSIFQNKATAEESIKNAGFKYWTIVRPCTFMDNFFSKVSRFQFPQLQKEHALVSCLKPATALPIVDTLVIANFCEAAFSNPQEYHRKIIDLAPEAPTLNDISQQMTRVIGIEIKAECLSYEDAVKRGNLPPILDGWDAINALEPKDTMKQLQAYQVKITTLVDYLLRNKEDILKYFDQ